MSLTEKEEGYILNKEEFVEWYGWSGEYKDYMFNMVSHKLLPEIRKEPIKALINKRKFELYLDNDCFELLVELLTSLNCFSKDIRV